jgi:hypothetical protein
MENRMSRVTDLHRDLAPGDAPGLEWQPRANGKRVPYWVAPRAAKAKGFTPKTVKLDADATPVELAASCRLWQAEALEFIAHGGAKDNRAAFDGTLRWLINSYQTDRISPFNTNCKWNTQQVQTTYMRVLSEQIGMRQIADVTGADVRDWYEHFRAPKRPGDHERIGYSNQLMRTLRAVLRFGIITEPRAREDCVRLAGKEQGILSFMRFEIGEARTTEVTADMVNAFRAEAHRQGYASIALATAIQFETALRQADVIGQWEPLKRGEVRRTPSALVREYHRWVGGLLWGEHVSADLVMIKPTSKSKFKKKAVSDWTLCPMIMEELWNVPPEQRIGPVVVHSGPHFVTGPWRRLAFWRRWKEIAAVCERTDPRWKGVQSMDMRSGAITEATEGVDAEGIEFANVQKVLGTHAARQMTQRYARGTLDKARAIQARRVAVRNGTTTTAKT